MNIHNNNNLFLLHEIVKKNFSSKYKDSTLGILWSLIRPLLTMIIFTIIFSTLFINKIENFPVYFLIGRCILDFFNNGVGLSMNALRWNKGILMQIDAPKHIFVLGCVISELINYLITLIILVGVMIATHTPFYFNTIPLSIIPILSLIIMMYGIGLIVSILCVYYSDTLHLWGIFSLLIMYSSAIFYPMEIVREPYRSYMMLNPTFWVIDQLRHLILWGKLPSTLNMINLVLLSVIILVLGLIVFKKYEYEVAKRF